MNASFPTVEGGYQLERDGLWYHLTSTVTREMRGCKCCAATAIWASSNDRKVNDLVLTIVRTVAPKIVCGRQRPRTLGVPKARTNLGLWRVLPSIAIGNHLVTGLLDCILSPNSLEVCVYWIEHRVTGNEIAFVRRSTQCEEALKQEDPIVTAFTSQQAHPNFATTSEHLTDACGS